MHSLLTKYIFYPVHEWLKGNCTISLLEVFEKSQWYQREEIEKIQLKKLIQLVKYSYNTVPYYTRMFAEAGISPAEILSTQDFSQIPFITKELIHDHAAELLSAAYQGKRIPYTTGGSTGQPLKFFVDNLRVSNEWAANWRARRWWGVDIGDKMLSIWASPIEASTQNRLKKIRDKLLNYHMIQALDLRESDVPLYLELLNHYKADYLFGYASCVFFLAQVIHKKNLKVSSRIKAIFTTADTLYPYQRKLIEEVFQAPVGIEYGARDGGFIAHECPAGGLHIFEEGVLVEIVDSQGRTLPDGQEGEVVVTVLDNSVMPFLRYKIGDYGSISRKKCSCGVNLKVMGTLLGRKCDNLLRSDGSIVHGPSLANILITNEKIERYQVIQNSFQELLIKIVSSNQFSSLEKNVLIKGIKAIYKDDIAVTIEDVDEIEPSPSGKNRYIICNIENQ
ncbi:MAG: phenylacetate--CoA ligase family protein [Pseudomonadota bacterium]